MTTRAAELIALNCFICEDLHIKGLKFSSYQIAENDIGVDIIVVSAVNDIRRYLIDAHPECVAVSRLYFKSASIGKRENYRFREYYHTRNQRLLCIGKSAGVHNSVWDSGLISRLPCSHLGIV